MVVTYFQHLNSNQEDGLVAPAQSFKVAARQVFAAFSSTPGVNRSFLNPKP